MKINLLVLGAQKCGTTTLHHMLDVHTDIYMSSPIKEPGYFLETNLCRRILRKHGYDFETKDELMARYMIGQGFGSQRYFGESSTYYTLGDWADTKNIPSRVYHYNREIKILYIVRNPIDRLKSNYLHSVQRGYVSGSIDHFIVNNSMSILTSMYNYQMKQYLSFFGKESFLVLTMQDLNRQVELSKKLSNFLDIDPFSLGEESSTLVKNKSKIKEAMIDKNLEISKDVYEKFLLPIEEDYKKFCETFSVEELPSNYI